MLDTKVTLVCTKCGEEKSTEDFNKNKNSNSGFQHNCKACEKIYRQDNKEEIAACRKIYRQDNKEEIAAYLKIYRQDNKEEIAAKQKIYRQDNKEEIAACKKIHYQDNKEEIAAKGKIYYQNNKEEIAAYKKIYNQDNKEEIAAKHKIYRQDNKEEIAAKKKIYRQNNPHKIRAKNSKRRAKKIQASPTWTSQFQKLQIDSLYNEAVNLERLTGVRYHLDHIHPLNNKYICGLHLPINLQLLSESENCSKSNKFECYTESEIDMDNPKPWECFYPTLSIENLEVA